MLSVEWSCLEEVAYFRGFIQPVLEFVKIVAIRSETDAKCTHALCYLDTLDTLSARRIITRGDIDRGVVGVYLAHSRDACGSIVPLDAIPKTLEEVERSSGNVYKPCPSLCSLLHQSR